MIRFREKPSLAVTIIIMIRVTGRPRHRPEQAHWHGHSHSGIQVRPLLTGSAAHQQAHRLDVRITLARLLAAHCQTAAIRLTWNSSESAAGKKVSRRVVFRLGSHAAARRHPDRFGVTSRRWARDVLHCGILGSPIRQHTPCRLCTVARTVVTLAIGVCFVCFLGPSPVPV